MGLTESAAKAMLDALNDYSLTGKVVTWDNPDLTVSPEDLASAAQDAIDDAAPEGVDVSIQANATLVPPELDEQSVKDWVSKLGEGLKEIASRLASLPPETVGLEEQVAKLQEQLDTLETLGLNATLVVDITSELETVRTNVATNIETNGAIGIDSKLTPPTNEDFVNALKIIQDDVTSRTPIGVASGLVPRLTITLLCIRDNTGVLYWIAQLGVSSNLLEPSDPCFSRIAKNYPSEDGRNWLC